MSTAVSTLNPCTCPECQHVVNHWFSDNCASGPHRFSPHTRASGTAKAPYGARQYNDSQGHAAGRRYWCSKMCQRSEERVYLMAQLELAQGRHDTQAIRILGGRLHELENHDAQIPSLPESLSRGQRPLPARAADPTDTDAIPPPLEGAHPDPTQLELDLLDDAGDALALEPGAIDIDGTPLHP